MEEEFTKYGLETVITSVNDSTHKEESYHYSGRAIDFRTKHAAGIMAGLFATIKRTLGPLGFDCIWEDQGLPNEHLHIELDKRAGY